MEHNGKIIIVADMGELKSYKVQMITATNRYHLELQNDLNYIEGRVNVSETLSDGRGRFEHVSGDDLGAEHENEQRLVQKIAEDISKVLANSQPSSAYLAFPTKHYKELTSALSDRAQKALTKNIAADLVKCPVEDLLSHF
ncbi:MAG: host attachment protein [Sulfuricurvum sp.]|uniref:host attachment protein n=1 Tax=Sulfuricurvum sp. TaxID=2025608 RepID=UPI0025F580EC|nr:host attachment protein [Sulfuricurvum sp.]MBV5321010.1 host attachment protein [Sulfuricurvum sp.]